MSEKTKVKMGGVCFRVDYLRTFATLSEFQKAHPHIDKQLLKEVYSDGKSDVVKVAKSKRGKPRKQ
jgi:hypothetical protein